MIVVYTLPMTCELAGDGGLPLQLVEAPETYALARSMCEKWSAASASSAVAKLIGAEDTVVVRKACANDGSKLLSFARLCADPESSQADIAGALGELRRCLRLRALALGAPGADVVMGPRHIGRLVCAAFTA